MTNEEIKRKVLSYIGLARRSGRIAIGSEQVIAAVRKNSQCAVVLASDASDRTKKQIKDKCRSYGVPVVDAGLTGDEIAHAAGKQMTVSASAVTETGLASAILKVTATSDESNSQLEERIFPTDEEMR